MAWKKKNKKKNLRIEKEKENEKKKNYYWNIMNIFYLPIDVSYAWRYSDVINWETNELFPTAGAPSIKTRYGVGPWDALLSRELANEPAAEFLAEPGYEAVRCSVLYRHW